MKSVIEQLFYNILEEPKTSDKTIISEEESEAYKKLKESLPEGQKHLLLRFDDLKNSRHLEEEKEFYYLGFQTGAQAVFEMLNIHFTV